MEDLIGKEWSQLSVAERFYLRHKLNVKKYQQKNMEKNRENCKKYYYKKKAEKALKDLNKTVITLAKIDNSNSNSIIEEPINIPE